MKTKHVSVLLASFMGFQSVAVSAGFENPLDKLKADMASGRADEAMLKSLVDQNRDPAIAKLTSMLAEIDKMRQALRSIQDTNEQDPFLKYANITQFFLIGASSTAVTSHLTAVEKKDYKLVLAAATAIINSVIRHYAEVKNLKPSEMGQFMMKVTHEMDQQNQLTPEMSAMANSLSGISESLLQQKSQLETVLSNFGIGSDVATGALIILAITHYVAPKLAKESEAILKKVSQGVATTGAKAAGNKGVMTGTGFLAGAPDLLGLTLGINSERSQDMITSTLNKLDISSRNLRIEIAKIQQAK